MNPEITLNNYEEYIILRIDGELAAAEEVSLEAFLQAHPELAGEAEAYAATKLPREEPPVLEWKAALLKPETDLPAIPTAKKRNISFLPWTLAAAAAVVAVSIGIRTLQTPQGPAPVVAVEQKKAPSQPATASTTPEAASTNPIPATSAPVRRLAVAQHTYRKKTTTSTSKSAPDNTVAALGTIPSLPMERLPVTTQSVDERLSNPEIIAMEPPEDSRRNGRLLEALPVESARLEGLLSLKETAKEGIQRVRAARQNLKNTEATFALAGHELFTLRF